MRLRVLPIGLFVLALAAIGGVAAWPALLGRARDALEQRLARETGRPWRIGSLSPVFDPAPGLVLGDVRIGDEAGEPGATVRRLRVAVPVALLLGQAGSGSAVAEDVTVRVPLASRPARAAPGGDGRPEPGALRPSAIRIAARGVRAQPSASEDALALTLRTVELGFDLAADAPAPALRLEAEFAEARTVIEADPPGADGARPLRLTLDPAAGPRIAATASARIAPATASLDAIAGRIDRAPFSGSLAVERGAKPRVVASLRLDALALTGEGGPAPRERETDALSLAVPADAIPDVAWFRLFEARADLAIARLSLGPVALAGVALTAQVKGGTLDAALVSAQVYDGSARGRYVLGPDGAGAGRHQVGLSLSGVRVRPLLGDLAGIQGLDGTGTARLDLQATGSRPAELLRTAGGAGAFSVVDGRIDGLDLARAAGLLGGSGGGLATRLDLVGGTVTVGEGRAVTNDLRLKTGLLDTEGVGSADLIGRSLDIRLKPLKVVPGAGGRLDVPIRISGPWADPAVTADLSGLARDPAGTLQGLQNLGGGILGSEDGGGGLGGLDGLLDAILPKGAPPRRQGR